MSQILAQLQPLLRSRTMLLISEKLLWTNAVGFRNQDI